jgi:uncharacterized protein YndB with AHSA1/START domain
MTYRTTIDIAASPESVWRVLMGVERWPEWTASVTTVKRLQTGMFRTGSRVQSHLQQTGPLGWLARLFFSRLTRSYLELESQGLKKRCEQEQ